MEEKKEITWESPEVSAEQMVEEQDANKERLAGILNLYAASRAVTREKIGRMNDEEVAELAELCFEEMAHRNYSQLIVCVNQDKKCSPIINGVVGSVLQIASSLTLLCVENEAFAECVLAVAKALQEHKEEIVAAIKEVEEE